LNTLGVEMHAVGTWRLGCPLLVVRLGNYGGLMRVRIAGVHPQQGLGCDRYAKIFSVQILTQKDTSKCQCSLNRITNIYVVAPCAGSFDTSCHVTQTVSLICVRAMFITNVCKSHGSHRYFPVKSVCYLRQVRQRH
jgi:hypothetical protein